MSRARCSQRPSAWTRVGISLTHLRMMPLDDHHDAVRPKLAKVLPAFAAEVQEGLHADPELSGQVAKLEIFGRCECGDSFCATFYTARRPGGAYGPGHRNVVVDGRLACVEVLHRGDVRRELAEACR